VLACADWLQPALAQKAVTTALMVASERKSRVLAEFALEQLKDCSLPDPKAVGTLIDALPKGGKDSRWEKLKAEARRSLRRQEKD
jgi:hypothetical protein